jgi:transcriptional regulator with XRE-family HTH domain
VDRIHVGTTFRAIRLELGLRQADVAVRAGTSQQTVSRVERGRFGPVSADALEAVAEAIEADLTIGLRWRGPKLARLLDRRHAQLQDRVARLLSDAGWDVRVEESFNYFGERGSVDILAWRPDVQALLLVEIKTELVDLRDTVRTLDVKARVVPRVVRSEHGWAPRAIAAVLVLPDANIHRAAVARHAALFAAALPARNREVRRWIAEPRGLLRGVWFLLNTHGVSTLEGRGCTQRVSRRSKRSRGAIAGDTEHRTSAATAREPTTRTLTEPKPNTTDVAPRLPPT